MAERILKLVDETIAAFIERLASPVPTPGGGTTAALEGALGSSLIAMVAKISAVKNRNGELEAAIKESENLKNKFLALVDEDSAAYDRIIAARRSHLAKEENSIKHLQDANRAALIPPQKIMNAALAGLELAKKITPFYYKGTASDLGLAAQSLQSAALGAELTILINLRAIKNEADFIETSAAACAKDVSRTCEMANNIYTEVKKSLLDYAKN